jgi:hypothetical protein
MDFRSKQEIIENIDSEVNELHPLLQAILSKLENITSAEYTHGPQEKGADFVLTRFDSALSTYHHIGVLVKVGKILNDLTAISRQIEECSLPRLIDGGKSKVRLSEIWVVNNSTISSNAKDKIHDMYAKQRIEFINGEHLTKLVDKHANYFWHQVPSPIGTYLQDLSRRIEMLEKESGVVGAITSEEFYVEPDIQEKEKISYVKDKRIHSPKMINLYDDVLRHNVSVLEGEMGFGKSKTARRLTQFYSSPEKFKQKQVLPVYCSFRLFHEKYKNLEELLCSELGQIYVEAKEKQYSILLILDGIDEAAINGHWKDTLKRVIADSKEKQKIHLFLTTRPLRLIDENVDIFSGVRRLLLRPLSISKVIQFIQKACESLAIPKKIFEDLQRSDLFKQLPQSPIAAALLSSLIAQNKNDLPSNLTELYSKSIDLMLGRWDVQKGITPEKEYLAAERVTMKIADYMVSNKLIWISEAEAKLIVEDWFNKRNTGVNLQDLIARVFDKSGIFTLDQETETVSFRHRSFGEYLYARNSRTNNIPFEIENAFDPYWVECCFFYVGLLGDCPDLLTAMFDKNCDSEGQKWIKILGLPDYVLAGYQTEYAIVENNLYKLFLEAASLHKKIKSGETKTKLTDLPEMHLLWFFQRLIRHCYNYEFLKPAVTSTICKIDSSEEDTSIKIYALFFAACFAAQFDDASGFEYILKTYSTEQIPLPIGLAIKMETQKKDFSKLALVKMHEKKLNALLTSSEKSQAAKNRINLSTENKLTELFEKPLKNRISLKIDESIGKR